MSSIRDAFTLRDKSVEIDGVRFTIRRPSVLDFLESMDIARTKPEHLFPHLVRMHLVEDGAPVFDCIDQVLAADALMVQRIARECEKLYEEGRD